MYVLERVDAGLELMAGSVDYLISLSFPVLSFPGRDRGRDLFL